MTDDRQKSSRPRHSIAGPDSAAGAADEPLRLACLYLETHAPAQRAATNWAAASDLYSVSKVPLAAIRDGSVDLAEFDVCWWHRSEPLTISDRVYRCRTAIRKFIEGGKGLLLTGRALSVVPAWGIDAVAPDEAGHELADEPVGYLRKALYRDHPIFSGLDSLRVRTAAGGPPFSYARYASVLPESGDVLGCTVRGDHDEPKAASLLSWQVGDGVVIGAGTALECIRPDSVVDGVAPESSHCLENATRLLENALGFCGDRNRWTGAVSVPEGRPFSSEELRRMRGALADDPHRPSYHLSPPANWLNDPNGMFEWNGQYHAFYQYNPGGPYHHAIHWGHAVSDDLVHWWDEPVALTPSPNGPDRDGCWSGCAVDDDGTPRLVYTGGNGRDQLPCLATAESDALTAWDKHDANPVIERVPDEPPILETDHWAAEFRDHCVWFENGQWYHLIGTGVQDVGGAVLCYVGTDLEEWTYLGPMLIGDWDGAGEVWECPELLDLGDKRLLHVSNYDDVVYFLGEFDLETGAFYPESEGLLDYGDYYAPQSMTCSDGRTLTWGWLPEARNGEAQWDAGWSGTLSLPREITLGDDDEIRQRPAAELEALRTERLVAESYDLEASDRTPIAVHTATLAADGAGSDDAITEASDDRPSQATADSATRAMGGPTRLEGRSLEFTLEVDFTDSTADAVEIGVLETEDRRERTGVRIEREAVVVDRRDTSLEPRTADESQRMPLELEDGSCSVHGFLDGSVLELFANERRCLTSRVYPTREDATGVSLAAHGVDDGPSVSVDLECWSLESAWNFE
ncbi:GH32 C-terminal domain-containing protein [Natronosalvus amylolyticus]|uniref:GH32 C-terminal domain-containing protein n=1 Tax=Natronosalvus amylolyticus TaxID=2961994 RepID=UPI0020C9836A|nr:GH32 C-terminal domain-containing protein [Natronosalvus amylolyticus]